MDSQLNQAFYLMRIALPADVVHKLGNVKLVPGMPAEVHFQTGERTMMAYLMKPLTDQYARASTER
jgi:HlyD family secretion protein